jgi:hypothetical protein
MTTKLRPNKDICGKYRTLLRHHQGLGTNLQGTRLLGEALPGALLLLQRCLSGVVVQDQFLVSTKMTAAAVFQLGKKIGSGGFVGLSSV